MKNKILNEASKSYMTTTTTTTKKSSKSSSLKSGASSSSSSSAKKNKSSAANISSCMSRYESPNSFSMTSNHTNSISSQHYLSTPPLETNNSFDRNIQHNLKITGDREIHFDSAITSINHSNSTTSPEISDLSSANIRSTTSNYTNSSGSWSSAIHHHSNPYSALLDESGSLHLASEAPSHSMFGHQHTATSAYHHHSGHPHSLSIGGLDCGTAAAAAAVAAAAYNAAYHHPATASTHQPYSHHQTITSHNNDSLTQSSPPPPLHQHRQQTHHPEAIVHDSIDTDSSQPNYSGSVSSATNIVLPSSESPSSTDVSVSVTTSNDIEHNNLLSRAPTTSFFSAENLLNYSSATRPHNQTNSYGAANTCSSTSDTTGNDIYAVAAAAAIHHGQRHGQYVMGGHSANSHHPYTPHHYGTAASTYHHQLHQNSGIATSTHPHHTSYNHDNFNHDDNGSTNLSGGYLRNPVTGLMYSETFSGFHDSNSSTTNAATNPYRLSSTYNYGHHHHQNMPSLNGSETYSNHHRNHHHHTSTSSLSNGSEHPNSTNTFSSVYGSHTHPHLHAFAAHTSLAAAAAANCPTNDLNSHQTFFNAASALDHHSGHHHHQHPHQTTDAFAGNFNMHVPLWNGLGMLSSASTSATNNHTPIVTDFYNGSSFSSLQKQTSLNHEKLEADDDDDHHHHHTPQQHHEQQQQQQLIGNKTDQYFIIPKT